MAVLTITSIGKIRKWKYALFLDSQAEIINKALSLNDKFSFIRATTLSKVEKEVLNINGVTRCAKLNYSSDQCLDRAMLFKDGLPMIATYLPEIVVPSPTSTSIPGGWIETICSAARVGDPFERLWWFNSRDEIELHPLIFNGIGIYSFSYNKLTQYTSNGIQLGPGESWFLDWQVYNRRTLDEKEGNIVEEIVFDEATLTAELNHRPVKDYIGSILYQHIGIETRVVPSQYWKYFGEESISFVSRDYYDSTSRYSFDFKYYQVVENPIISYIVELSQSEDNEVWTEWEEIYQEHLVDRALGSCIKFRLTVDEIEDINSFRFKAFCARKVSE